MTKKRLRKLDPIKDSIKGTDKSKWKIITDRSARGR